ISGRSVRDGNSISFWGDNWCGTRPLKDYFPRVYALDENKLCTVAQRINIKDWSFVLKIPPRGSDELNQLDELIQVMRDVVLKRIDVDSLLCPICNEHVKNVDHLFFACEMAHDLWGLLARWYNLDISEVSNITEWFSWLDDVHVPKSARIILEWITSTMMWSVWSFCNSWIFLSSKPKKANIQDSIVHYSFLWISFRNLRVGLDG
nr:RNA-directed DNA polymerase, eukaryota, reverse transcriptase zinc-binding domain protein [Tanacetum cinerariifolium]